MTLKRERQSQPLSFARRIGAMMVGGLVWAGTLSEVATANWYDPPRPSARWDEPLFVASEPQEPSLVWRYGHDSIMPVVAMQDESPLPPPVPMVPMGPMVPLAENAEVIDSPSSDQQEYGEPLEDFNVQFLRSASVLLQPGQWQFDYGLIYAVDDYDYPISLNPSGVARADIKRRTLQVPFALRYGWSEHIQLTSSLPVGWSSQERSSLGLFDETSSKGGIGDLELGMNILCRKGCYGYSPDVILTLGLTVPTGDATYPINGPTQAALANGVWAPSAQLLMIQRYDPIIYFYGIGYRYQAKRQFSGQDVRFGHQFTYNFGVGFAVNDRITLSTSFLGLFQTETEVNGQGLPGSMRDPLRMRFAATTYHRGKIVEPFAEIGMTQDAVDAIVGIVWTL